MAMESARLVLFFGSVFIQFLALSIAQPNFLLDSCSDGNGNFSKDKPYPTNGRYTTNSPYERNLNATLFTIASNGVVNYGFYNESFGQEPDRVNALALCRGDVPVDVCRSCVRNAARRILQVCPNQKAAVGWYDECMIRYSNSPLIFSKAEFDYPIYMSSTHTVTENENEFERRVQDLLRDLKERAASGDWRLKFATHDVPVGFKRIYALVQCTPDLTKRQCTDCLNNTIGQLSKCCDRKTGGRVLNPSCNFRFETGTEPFFGSASGLPPLASSPAEGNTTPTVIIVIIPIVGVALLVLIGICIFLRWRKFKENTGAVDEIQRVESLQFDFNTVKNATNNFSDDNKLGQGGFGAVYKGTLSDGEDIAVKRLSRGSGQGDLQFKNEVLLVAKLQHRNLVRLLGFCLEENERLLIYEFVPNTSLDHFIFDPRMRAQLDWKRRYKIIEGVARGLLYLHEDSRLRIIHRDLKAGNILLDAKMEAKIADFGMARLFEMDETQGNTNAIAGTYGYMAPEYAMHGQFSVKSDVFSFGVLVLEIMTGQKNNCFCNEENVEHLIGYAWKSWRKGASLSIVDPTLTTGSRTEILRCIHIGLLCVQENVAHRPTMASVVLMLSSYSLTLPVPSEPAFFIHSTISDHSGSEVLPCTVNEVSITELDPR